MAMDAKAFLEALEEIEISKGINKQTVLTALEEALKRVYTKFLGGASVNDESLKPIDVRVAIDTDKGTIDMWQVINVVEEVEDDLVEISPEDAKEQDPFHKDYKVGDEFEVHANVDDMKKSLALSVKSIMKQKFVEAEKEVLKEQFQDKIGTMITGKVEKVEERGVSVNIGKASVYLPKKEMIGDERFVNGSTIKLFVCDVASSAKTGAHIVVSRANEGFLTALFQEEIHEIYDGTIVIKGCAREAGVRSKVAVYSKDPNVDPAGACIGPNGSRIQKIVGQLGNSGNNENIDIIAYSDNAGLYIIEALKPAKVSGIIVSSDSRNATAIVQDDSLSLAIGKKGVNARLAVKLTGYKIDIKTETEAAELGLEYKSIAELQAEEAALKNKILMEEKAKEYESAKETVLPGMAEGYVAPQDRVYDDEVTTDVDEALEAAADKEEENEVEEIVVSEPTPVIVEAPVEEVEEPVEEEKREVKTTTSLEELEKNLASEANKQKNKGQRKSYKKTKKDEEEEEETTTKVSETGPRMSIYTAEELEAMEAEENEQESYEDEDVDYDEYDSYYEE